MKKKILLYISCLLLVVITAVGCKKSEGVTPDGQIGNNGQEDSKGDEDSKEEVTKQELNIIDDNYRNFYEIFVGGFYDSDGDGMGDINGIIEKLDYINDGDDTTDTDLGFNGIWLMPIMPSVSYHKYDVVDYYDIDPEFGTLDDFKRLARACEERGIALIIDFVFNHTSSKHPWFLDAVSYLEKLPEGEEPNLEVNPYVGYYNFTSDDMTGDKYHKAGSSDWSYEGVFWGGMPDLKLENPKLREEIEHIAKFWLDLGVSGFRLDAAKEFYSGGVDSNVEVLDWFTSYVKSQKEDAYIVAEVWDSADIIAQYYNSGILSLFNFPFAQHTGLIVKTARQFPDTSGAKYAKALLEIDAKYRSKNPDYIDAPFISNHDTTRVSAQAVNNEEQMKLAAGLLLTLNGSPYVYYGEEIGMNSSGTKDENKRLPMRWSSTDQTGIPNPPVGADPVVQKFPAVDEQMANPLSIYNYYKKAVRLRNENPEIARGELSLVEELCSDAISAVKKVYEGSEIVILSNVSVDKQDISLADGNLSGMSLRGFLTVDGSEVTVTDDVVSMPKYSIVILKK